MRAKAVLALAVVCCTVIGTRGTMAQAPDDPGQAEYVSSKERQAVGKLKARNAKERERALRAIQRMEKVETATLDAVAASLADKEAAVRSLALYVYMRHCADDDKVLAASRAALRDRDPKVRSAAVAVTASSRFRPLADADLQSLANMMKDPDEEARRFACSCLQYMGAAAKPILPTCIELLGREPDADCVGVVANMELDESDLRSFLEAALKRGTVQQRSSAISAFGHFRPLSAEDVASVASFVTDEHPSVREKAIRILLIAGPNRKLALPAISKALSEYPDLAEYAGRFGPAVAPAVEGLRAFLSHESSIYRGHAAEALGFIGNASAPAIPQLGALLDDEFKSVRQRALYALGDIGPAAKQFAPDVTEHFDDEDSSISAAACYAYWRMTGETEMILPVLERLISSSSDSTARKGAYVAGAMGPDAMELVPLLVEAAGKKKSWQRQWAAIWALGKMGKDLAMPAAPVLRKRVEEDPQDYLAHAGLAVLEGNVAEHVAVVIDRLKLCQEKGYGYLYASAAIAALGELGPLAKEAIPVLEERARSKFGYEEVLMIEQAIAKMRGEPIKEGMDETLHWLRM